MKDTSKEILQRWFNVFKSTVDFYKIVDENIHNMDESGFSIRQIEASCVIINKEMQTKY